MTEAANLARMAFEQDQRITEVVKRKGPGAAEANAGSMTFHPTALT